MNPFFFIYLSIIVLSCVLSFSLYPIFPSIDDPRLVKDTLSILFALGITGLCFLGRPRRYKVYPLLSLLIFYSIFRCFLGPSFRYQLLNTEVDNIWQYKPVLYMVIFFAFFTAVSNLSWTSLRLRQIFSVLTAMGFLTSVYIFIQALGLDQWLVLKNTAEAQHTPSAAMTATMRNVTFSSAFLVMVLPFMLQSRRWISAIIALIAIALCKSQMAIGTALVTLIIYGLLRIRWDELKQTIAFVIFFFILSLVPYIDKPVINDSGRFPIWKQMWTDVKSSPLEGGQNYFLTGYGIGTYKYLFTTLHTTEEIEPGVLRRGFEEAHNDPFEWFYNTGFIGLAILIFIVFYLIKNIFPYTLQDERYLALLVCFISSFILSCGTFVWQIEPHRFITVVVAAIMYNRIIKEEKERWEEKHLVL